MQSNTRDFPQEILEYMKLNKHLLMGYLFLALVFFGAISSVYYWENKRQMGSMVPDANRHVESGEQVVTNGEPCEPELVLAINPETSETREYSSPCYVVPPWEKVVNKK